MTLTKAEVHDAGLTGWAMLSTSLRTRYPTGDFATGLKLVNLIAEASESAGHHPDLTLTYGWVQVRLSSHDVGGVSQRDVDLAQTITRITGQLGLTADVSAVAEYELGLDAADAARVGPFWAALLTGSTDSYVGGDEVSDPLQRVPLMWFQPTEEHETPRQRFHIDLWLDPSVVASRIEAAVAAGGIIVDDSPAPSFIVLADPDGNRACICTSLNR